MCGVLRVPRQGGGGNFRKGNGSGVDGEREAAGGRTAGLSLAFAFVF